MMKGSQHHHAVMAVSRRVAILAATLAVKSFMMKILMLSDVYFPRVNGVPTSIESFRGAAGTRIPRRKL